MQVQMGDLPDGPVVKLLPSNTGGAGSILSQGTKISYASGPKNKAKQNIKWKQCCNKLNKALKKKTRWVKSAAAAAKLLQSCLILWDPIDGSPPGSPILGILQARILEWVAISSSNA